MTKEFIFYQLVFSTNDYHNDGNHNDDDDEVLKFYFFNFSFRFFYSGKIN